MNTITVKNKNKIIIGIDGGGTKSHLGLFDMSGKCLGVFIHGPLNHECMEGSFEQLEEELRAFILNALKEVGASVDDVAYGVFGLAGVDTRRQHETISQMLRNAGLTQFTLCNDAYLGVAAGCPGVVGICAINGTGSTMAAIGHSGATVQIGGIGDISNDCGGSSWYGLQMLGLIYDELFKGGQATILKQMIFDKIGVTYKQDYTETLTSRIEDDVFFINDINCLVFKAAAAGDAIALRLLDESADHYAGGIAYLAKEMDFPVDQTLHVTLAGSVFVKEQVKILPQLIEERVCGKLGDRPIEFLSLEVAPVAGAISWAFQKAGVEMEMDLICEELKKMDL